MEVSPLMIEQLPDRQVLREDDHLVKASTYFQIHPCNFKFTHYDHGTPELKQKYQVGKHLFRYFNKRNFLFSKFEQGIAIDEESWYSVIPEAVSHHLRHRFKNLGVRKIFQPFSGVGGIAIHLCQHFQEYIVNDLDVEKLRMLEHNMQVYNKNVSRLKFMNLDFLEVQPFETDALIICPPWGGIDTSEYTTEDPDTLMKPKLTDILVHAKKFSGNILLQMPKQTNLGHLIRIFKKLDLAPVFTVEKIMTNQKCSQLFFYLGSEHFIKIQRCQLYSRIYKDLGTEDKYRRKKIKEAMKDTPGQISEAVYKSLYPEKKMRFIEKEEEKEK